MSLKEKIGNNFLLDANILVSTILIFSIKWFLIHIYNQDTLLNKILFDYSDLYYFPFILNILELDISPQYLDNYTPNKNIPIPIYSILLHSIFFKIFGLISFYILEFFFLFIFLILIFNILIKCNLNYNFAIFSTLIIFLLPFTLKNIDLFNINLNIISGLFSFRFPRPLVTSCFFFWGIYLAILYYKNERLNFKNSIYIGICFSLLFASYYYNFVNLILLFAIIFVFKNINDITYLRKNYKNILNSIIFFLILSIPFLLIYFSSEKDFFLLIGGIELNFEFKKKLLIHFINKIFSIKFIVSFVLLTIIMFTLLKHNDFKEKKIIKLFYFMFLASIISPFFFVLLSPSISEIYHFLNWIVITTIFVSIIYLLLVVDFVLKKFDFFSIKYIKYLFLFISFIVILSFNFLYFDNLIGKNDKQIRKEYQNLQILVDNNNFEYLLTFIPRVQVLWMLKNKTKFNSIESSYSSLNFNQLEQNFVENLKFLNINKIDFADIISNKKGSWRYNNEFVKYFSWYKYQANSLITFKNTNDFKYDEAEFIKKSSPTKTQQIIIPQFEINRLLDLYDKLSLNQDLKKPDLIVLKNDSLVENYSFIDPNIYCRLNNFKLLKIYYQKKSDFCE